MAWKTASGELLPLKRLSFSIVSSLKVQSKRMNPASRIHLNPLRAKLVSGMSELNKYPYSGHSTIMNNIERDWQDVKYVLGYFSKSSSKARKEYVKFDEEGKECILLFLCERTG